MRVRKFVETADYPEINESSQLDNEVKSHYIFNKELSGLFSHLCYMNSFS